MNNPVKHTRRTEAQIRALLNLQAENNGITVKEFCRINKIHKANFYNWRNKYGVGIAKPAQFIPVHLNEAVHDVTLFAEIELSSTVKVRLFQKVDAAYFKALLK